MVGLIAILVSYYALLGAHLGIRRCMVEITPPVATFLVFSYWALQAVLGTALVLREALT